MQEGSDFQSALNQYFGHDNAHKYEVVQSLWGGYGEIRRYWDSALQSNGKQCISKLVNPQQKAKHPRGWDTNTSHQRKLLSYVNEQYFYRYFAPYTTARSQVPMLIDSGEDGSCLWMIMQDLDAAGFTKRNPQASMPLLKLVTQWLANFHARFLINPKTKQALYEATWPQHINKLWATGTYWYLSTRMDEFHVMPNSRLKEKAGEIDKILNGAKFQTLVHGDAKLANFCFNKEVTSLAAVDFQYVGRGAGIKDFVYFLGSCLDSQGLYQYAPQLLEYYFIEFKQASMLPHNEFVDLESEYRALYAFAWADFERFLQGWSPGHNKLNSYSNEQTQIALKSLTA